MKKHNKRRIKKKLSFNFLRSLVKSKGALSNGLLFVGMIMSVLVLGSFSITGYAPALPYEKPEPTITPTPTIAPPFPLPSGYGEDKDDGDHHDDDHHDDPQ